MFRGMGNTDGHIMMMHPDTQQRMESEKTAGGVTKKRVTFEDAEEPKMKKAKSKKEKQVRILEDYGSVDWEKRDRYNY